MLREGYSVVIVGAPNAGKSSLLNALARRDVAIVTDEPGTTRDLVHVSLDLNGVKVIVTDTAGIREGAGQVGAIGIERAWESAGGRPGAAAGGRGFARCLLSCGRTDGLLKVGSKVDLVAPVSGGRHDLDVSAMSGVGVNELLTMIGSVPRPRLIRAVVRFPRGRGMWGC